MAQKSRFWELLFPDETSDLNVSEEDFANITALVFRRMDINDDKSISKAEMKEWFITTDLPSRTARGHQHVHYF